MTIYHLGTATFVTNSQGEATQFFLNLPFGETMFEQMDGSYDNAFKFNAKELDEDTGLYYYGARYYNPRLSIWYGVDPLAEKMPSWSPYVYTFDNPVRYTDPDGMAPNDIIIRYLGSDGKIHTYDYKYGAGYNGRNKYLIAFHTAANYLIKNGAGDRLKALDARKEKLYVTNLGYTDEVGANFDNIDKITWNPIKGIESKSTGKRLSPTAVLDHEFDHAEDYFKDPDKHMLNVLKPTGDGYHNAEEMRVIQGSEQSTAKKLELIKENEVTRKDHEGDIITTVGVTSPRKPNEIPEVVITPKKKK